MANLRTCTVAFTDHSGVRHSVEVMASTLFEAAVLGLTELRRCTFADAAPGQVTILSVTVKTPATTHEVRMRSLEEWLKGGARSPKEAILKDKLREILRSG